MGDNEKGDSGIEVSGRPLPGPNPGIDLSAAGDRTTVRGALLTNGAYNVGVDHRVPINDTTTINAGISKGNFGQGTEVRGGITFRL
jgi:hypothetical protein